MAGAFQLPPQLTRQRWRALCKYWNRHDSISSRYEGLDCWRRDRHAALCGGHDYVESRAMLSKIAQEPTNFTQHNLSGVSPSTWQ